MRAKKSLGQNFLNDNDILNNIINIDDISNEDIVLEIGPGTGNLTKKILEKKPKNLIVIEKDNELANNLKNTFGDKLEVINNDILNCYKKLKFDKPIKIYGNLPYNISTKILVTFLKINNLNKFCKKLIFIFQKEVAERIVANENSKNYGRLSILTACKMTRKKMFDISPISFFPKPKVWSSLVVLEPLLTQVKDNEIEKLEYITKIFFSQRRKMIKRPFKQLFNNYVEIANKLNINLDIRPQNISEKKYLEICKLYNSIN